MSQGKIQFAQRVMTVALVCIAIATFIALKMEFNRIYSGPRYSNPIGPVPLMALTAIVGFLGSVLSFILFLLGGIEPAKKPVYFARTKMVFFSTLAIFMLAFLRSILEYVAEDDFPNDFTRVIFILALIFMVMSGIASLGFYLAGWGAKKQRSIKEAFAIPRVSRDGESSSAPFEKEDISYSPARSMFVVRLGSFFTGIAKFIAFSTIPCAVIIIVFSYSSLERSSNEGYIILVGPFILIYTAIIGFGISAILALIGFILKYIGRGGK